MAARNRREKTVGPSVEPSQGKETHQDASKDPSAPSDQAHRESASRGNVARLRRDSAKLARTHARRDIRADLEADRAARLAEHERRIAEVAAMLVADTYRSGRTLDELAIRWCVTRAEARSIAFEASKRVKEECTEPAIIAAAAFPRLERLAIEGMTGEDTKGEVLGHRKLALAATREAMLLSGAAAPAKSMVAIADLTTMTDEELAAKRRELVMAMAAEDSK